MITAIKKLNGLGVFGNFTAANNLPPFGRFNVIYGENGSGKTTLSRLFGALENGEHPEYPDLGFTIITDVGPLTKGQKYSHKIRVFNSDYVEANIGQFQGPIRHILIVGQENKALAETLKVEQLTLSQRKQAIEAATDAAAKLDQDKGKIFSGIAKTISEAIIGAGLRNYRKPDAEAAFSKIVAPKALTDEELERHRATVRQEQLDRVSQLDLPVIAFAGNSVGLPIPALVIELAEATNRLTLRSAQSGALKRLTEEPALGKWVEDGLRLHKAHGSQRCEFCDQTLPALRMAQLAEHFGVEDQLLKQDIESARATIGKAQEAVGRLQTPPKSAFYSELRDEVERAVAEFEAARSGLTNTIINVGAALDHKLSYRATSYAVNISIDLGEFQSSFDAVNTVIAAHNEKTERFSDQKDKSKSALEEHYLSTIKDHVTDLVAKIADKGALVVKLTTGADDLDDKRSFDDISKSILEKQAKVINAHAGGAELTSFLKKFLGRTDLTLESGQDGYHVMRRGKPAKRLSEGEKTAIAFLYFIVQLSDQNFDIADGVVVIDDPISSLNSSSIYQAFSFLKNAVKNAKQIVLLTHNFEFLRLILNWFHNIKKADGSKSYYMIVCTETASAREAAIVALDQLLQDHTTEYNYLFKILHSYKSDGTIASCYHIPNVARKVLDTFLEFYSPGKGSIYAKLEAATFDSQKKTAIYKFANDLSHHTGKGFDPALVAETQKNTEYLLEMIKSLAPVHYDALEKLSVSRENLLTEITGRV